MRSFVMSTSLCVRECLVCESVGCVCACHCCVGACVCVCVCMCMCMHSCVRVACVYVCKVECDIKSGEGRDAYTPDSLNEKLHVCTLYVY